MENLSDLNGRWESRRLIASSDAAASDLLISYKLFEMTERGGSLTYVMYLSVLGDGDAPFPLVLGGDLAFAKTFFDLAHRGAVTPCTVLDVLEDLLVSIAILH